MDLTDDDRLIVHRVARSIGRERWIPREDLVQEAEIRLWRSEYDPKRCERGAFVSAVSRGAMLDWLRGPFLRSRSTIGHRFGSVAYGESTPDLETDVDDDRIPNAVAYDERWEAIDARLDVERYLRRYPRRTRQALRLRYLEALPVKDCADRMGVTEAGYYHILRHGSERGLHEPSLSDSIFFDPNAPRPPKRTARQPAELRALVEDVSAFLELLSPVVRSDTRAWLDGISFEEIAAKHSVQVQSARNNITRAFARAHESRRTAVGATT